MTPTVLVWASVGLGVFAGALGAWAVLSARAAGRRRTESMRPALPEAAVELLRPLDSFAVILDASLSPVFANPAARNDGSFRGDQLRDPDFLERARKVMTTGVTDTIDPDPGDPNDTFRVRIVRVQRRFVVVFADDLGEEQRVNAMRRDFIANVSHELKTPIAAISLLSEAIHEGADDPEIVRSFAKKLRKASRRLADLARDVIQLSEAQSTLKPQDREAFSLVDVLRGEIEAHQHLASEGGIELVLTRSEEDDSDEKQRDPILLGHRVQVATVFANLLSNAIRHSAPGSRVGVGMRTVGGETIVTVTDQGEGIPPEHLSRLFERFYRVDTARSREAGGTGLGLSIARHAVQAHGGNIEVWSQEGVGSSFTVTLPMMVDEVDKKRKKKAKKKAKKKEKSEAASARKAAGSLSGADSPSSVERSTKGES